MPNYRYNAPEYARRGSCGRNMQAVPAAPVTNNCQHTVMSPCCEDRAVLDELMDMPVGMAYVPWQQWRALYEVEKGFHCGTIFEELNKPFCGTGGGVL